MNRRIIHFCGDLAVLASVVLVICGTLMASGPKKPIGLLVLGSALVGMIVVIARFRGRQRSRKGSCTEGFRDQIRLQQRIIDKD